MSRPRIPRAPVPGRSRDPFTLTTAALLVAMAAACGDPAPVPLAQFSEKAKDAICDWAVRCRHVPTRAICERLLDPKDYDIRRTADAIAAGRLAYDPHAAARCILATADAYCLTPPFSDPSCGDVLIGRLPEGGACTADNECPRYAKCASASCDAQCCLGTCGAPEPPPDAAPLAGIGEPCRTHFDCVPQAYCETDGVCTRMPDQPGERCLFGCARGDLYCDTNDLTCHAYAGLGQACDASGAAAPPCDPAWSFCDGVCKVRPGPGEPCGNPMPACIASSYCDKATGLCQARGNAGDPCTNSDQCQVACDTTTGTCVAYRACATGTGSTPMDHRTH